MQPNEIVRVLQEKAGLYGDHELAFIAQSIDLHTSLSVMNQPRPGRIPGLVSVYDAAKHLSLSTDYIWKLIYSGDLKSLKIGKRRLIKITELDAFIKKRSEGGDGH
jgi:excisionase family DNA binding protein